MARLLTILPPEGNCSPSLSCCQKALRCRPSLPRPFRSIRKRPRNKPHTPDSAASDNLSFLRYSINSDGKRDWTAHGRGGRTRSKRGAAPRAHYAVSAAKDCGQEGEASAQA